MVLGSHVTAVYVFLRKKHGFEASMYVFPKKKRGFKYCQRGPVPIAPRVTSVKCNELYCFSDANWHPCGHSVRFTKEKAWFWHSQRGPVPIRPRVCSVKCSVLYCFSDERGMVLGHPCAKVMENLMYYAQLERPRTNPTPCMFRKMQRSALVSRCEGLIGDLLWVTLR